MKKRLLLLLIVLAVLLCGSGVSASGTMCFVAVNDTIPLSLPGDAAPYYSGGTLYIPYSAFDANPGSVVISNNTDQNTLVLFTRTLRLVFDLTENTVTDEKDNVSPVTVAYRNGILFIPASSAAHFGLSVSLLTSQSGYPVLRFTNGSQVYDDELFVEKAENLIQYMVQQEENPSQGNPSNNGGSTTTQTPVMEEPPREVEPATVYLAFSGDAVTQDTLDLLAAHDLRAAFFLTSEQFVLQTDLVRSIYAAGHTVGITAEGSSMDYAMALDGANDAMDRALFCKSVFALAPEERAEELTGYRVLTYADPMPTVQEVLSVTGEPQLLLCKSDPSAAIQALLDANANLPQLLETTQLPGKEEP